MAALSGWQIFFVVVVAILAIALVTWIAWDRSQECPRDAISVTTGGTRGCFLSQPTFVCLTVPATVTQGTTTNGTYVVASINNNYGCLLNPNTNECLTFTTKAACDSALNNLDQSAVPNIQTTPSVQPQGSNPGMKVCTAADYSNPASFCNFMLTRFATTT